jgi:hypothetical protein
VTELLEHLLPVALPPLRPATPADHPWIARCINEGRAAGVFQAGPMLAASDVAAWQAEQAARGGYQC